MKSKSKIFLLLITVSLAMVLGAQLGGSRRALAAGRSVITDHAIKVTHKHNSDDTVTWGLKEKGKSAFHLAVKRNKTLEWDSRGNNETNMSIIVNNTTDWLLPQGGVWIRPPMYGPGC